MKKALSFPASLFPASLFPMSSLPMVLLPGFTVAVVLMISVSAFAQGQAAAALVDNDFLHKQFGNQFTLVPGVAAAVGDLNGDGVEDIVIAARCKNPMLDQAEHNYTVVDPYYDFFGFGDPKITTTFSEPSPELRGLVVLVIDGAKGDAGWKSTAPKAKYVIVNLPYRAISVRKMRLRKKSIDALYVEEASETGESSAVFFDGRKFRYVPMGGDME